MKSSVNSNGASGTGRICGYGLNMLEPCSSTTQQVSLTLQQFVPCFDHISDGLETGVFRW